MQFEIVADIFFCQLTNQLMGHFDSEWKLELQLTIIDICFLTD